jgi:hypothetical protein
MMNPYFLMSAALGAALLGGCAGASTTSATPHQATSAATTASIIIVIPSANTSASLRRIAYVSTLSRSATLALAPSAGCAQCTPPFSQDYPLTGQGSPCTSGSPRTCTIPLLLAPGTYTASLKLFDGFVNAQGAATGNPLSEQTAFPVQVTLGQSNAIGVTLAGVPATLVQTVTTPSTLFLTTRVQNGAQVPIYRFSAAGASAQITLTAKDAAGLVIAGPGAPTWSANATGTGYTAAVTGNTLTLNNPSTRPAPIGSLSINAVSSACADPAAVCSANVALGLAQTLAIADTAGGNVQIWPIGAAIYSAYITTGINGPLSVAFASDGTLFVANLNNSTVTYYAPPYTGTPQTISTKIANPVALIIDAQNDVIVANAGGNVTIYPPPYTTTTPVTLSIGSQPSALALDATQHLWAVSTSGSLYRFPAPYTAGGFDVSIGQAATGFNQPKGLALDSLGRLYVANSGSNNVLRFDPPYSSQSPSATIATNAGQPMTNPANVIVGSGDVMLAGSQDGLDVYSSSGAPLGLQTTKFYKPRGLAIDADGIVWVATGSGNGATGIPPPYDGTNLVSVGLGSLLSPSSVAVY